ncbi:MAG: ABC transporter ATP-binding protein [Acidimicrobiia bacterium]|nr:MAG: ABC transporter ATP-binding protein [Acidimicrobiia bacterium]
MSEETPVLEFRGVNIHYGPVHVLKDMDLAISQGELVCLLGGNASGKTTTLKTVLGMVRPSSGDVLIDGEIVTNDTTAQIVSRGVTMVPENRRLFKRMTVRENLEIGAFLRTDRDSLDAEMDHIFEMFPRVKERINQKAGTLSGGEQQMVAVGRALMAKPKVLLMDEPSMGLAPVLVQQNFDIIERINDDGVTVFMVEQNANMALSIADRGYVLLTGSIVLADTAENLLANEDLRKAYLGETE